MKNSFIIKPILLCALFLCALQVACAQNNFLDSLKNVLQAEKNDSVRIKILSALSENAADGEWQKYNGQIKTLAEKKISTQDKKEKLFYLKFLGGAINDEGFNFEEKGNIKEALKKYTEALAIREQANDKPGMAQTLNNLGSIYLSQGDINRALNYLSQSLGVYEKCGSKAGEATSLNNLGSIFQEQGELKKAEEYFKKAFEIAEQIKDPRVLAAALNALGNVLKEKNKTDSAIVQYKKSIELYKSFNNSYGVAAGLQNIAVCLATRNAQGDNEKAVEYYSASVKMLETMGDRFALAVAWNGLANIYFKQNNILKAKEFATRSLNTAKEIGYPNEISRAANILSKIFRKEKDYKAALEMYELSVIMGDSTNNAKTRKAGIKQQLKYDYEKKAAADSVKNVEEQKVKDAQLNAQNASLKQEKLQRYSLAFGLIIVLGGLGFVINRFRVTSKQKKIIEEQKIAVDEAFGKLHEKNKEVMDSIYYARRIQRALITSEHYITKQLKALKRN